MVCSPALLALPAPLRCAPPATADAFWRENSEKLVDNNCQLLRVLLKLLETSRDSTTLAVGCQDLAQFVSHISHGAPRRQAGAGAGLRGSRDALPPGCTRYTAWQVSGLPSSACCFSGLCYPKPCPPPSSMHAALAMQGAASSASCAARSW